MDEWIHQRDQHNDNNHPYYDNRLAREATQQHAQTSHSTALHCTRCHAFPLIALPLLQSLTPTSAPALSVPPARVDS